MTYLHNRIPEYPATRYSFLHCNSIFPCYTGLTLENFIPFVDYKERAQQWRWIGAGRDSDDILTPLCKHWLENKDEMSLDISDRADAATPPPRS